MQPEVVYEARARTELIKQGFLTKSPPLEGGSTLFKKWQRRWVVLRCDDGNMNLQYFKGERDVSGQSLGTIMLDNCTGVQKSMRHSTYKNIFAINTPSRDYYFSADSKHEMDEWVLTICSTLGLQSDTRRTLVKKKSANAVMPSESFNAHTSRDGHHVLARSTSDGRFQAAEHFSVPGSSTGFVPLPGQEAGRATLARDHQMQPTECGAHMDIYVDKHNIVQNVVFVEVLGLIWIAGWQQKNPSLHGLFRVGDQVLAINGKEVRATRVLQHAVECTAGMVQFTIKRTPYALDVHLQKRSISEPLGIAIDKNKLTDIVPGGVASQCGLSLRASGIGGKCVPWVITEINGRPVPMTGIKTEETMKRVHAAGMDVTLTLQPTDFWKMLKKKLKSAKNWEEFMAK